MKNETEFILDKEMLNIWFENMLYEYKKNSAEEMTSKEIEKAIEDIKGTISNERLWSYANPIHFENIANLEAYLSKLEKLLEEAKQRERERERSN